MKRTNIHIFAVLALLLGLAACTQDEAGFLPKGAEGTSIVFTATGLNPAATATAGTRAPVDGNWEGLQDGAAAETLEGELDDEVRVGHVGRRLFCPFGRGHEARTEEVAKARILELLGLLKAVEVEVIEREARDGIGLDELVEEWSYGIDGASEASVASREFKMLDAIGLYAEMRGEGQDDVRLLDAVSQLREEACR